jgi:glycine/D-amino acid oxidase-like deaminating enzyme/nitrite reductase/ring-hydroxylating ferredoxin subunit
LLVTRTIGPAIADGGEKVNVNQWDTHKETILDLVIAKTRQASPSFWQETAAPLTEYPALHGKIEADVAIVGGGITGLTAAAHLAAAGRKVVVLEANRIGSGTTGDTSAHLDVMPEQGSEALIRDFGLSAARAVTQARMAAIVQIEAWCRELEIDGDFRRVPAYMYSESPEGMEALREEREHARRLGLEVAMVDAIGLPFARGGLRIENQARFHALGYLQGLAESLHADGVVIHERSPVQPPRDDEPCTLETPQGRVIATDVLLCTHTCYMGITEIDTRIAPYQSYVLTARVATQIPDALFWDDVEPYHYLRVASSKDPRLLVVGGADHKTSQGGDEREAMARLEQYVQERFHVEAIEHQWSAEFLEPADGLPYIGRLRTTRHVMTGAGYSGTGLTYGTVAGRVLADLHLGRASELAEIFSPSRFKPIAAGLNYLSENLNVAKHFVADRFSGDTIESLDEVHNGEGRLVRYRGYQRAVYRDEQGAIHVLSPVCTHAGCRVQWNEFESTWDCPCHGGRFSALGKRLYGPPPNDLEPQALDDL